VANKVLRRHICSVRTVFLVFAFLVPLLVDLIVSAAGVDLLQNRHRSRHRRSSLETSKQYFDYQNNSLYHNASLSASWPAKRVAEIDGDIVIGGLHMLHEREDRLICGPLMPQGGLQAAEVMLFTVDKVNERQILPEPLKLGAYLLDDCDKDTYGLQMAVDFIKGKCALNF